MNTPQTEILASASRDSLPHDDLFALPAPGVHLFFRGGSRDDTSVTIDRHGCYLLGRAQDAAIRFSDTDSVDCKVSHRHAALHVDAEQVRIVNRTPHNGLKIDGIPLQDHQELVLNDSDVITLGNGGPIIRVRIGSLEMAAE